MNLFLDFFSLGFFPPAFEQCKAQTTPGIFSLHNKEPISNSVFVVLFVQSAGAGNMLIQRETCMHLAWVSVQWCQLSDATFVVHAVCVMCQCLPKITSKMLRLQSMLSSQLNPWLTPLLHMIEFYPHCVHQELLRKKACDQRKRSLSGKIPYALANIAVALRFFVYSYAFGRAAAVTLRHACDRGNLAVSFIQVPAEFLSTRTKALQSASCWLWLHYWGFCFYISPPNALPVSPALESVNIFSACTGTKERFFIHIANYSLWLQGHLQDSTWNASLFASVIWCVPEWNLLRT